MEHLELKHIAPYFTYGLKVVEVSGDKVLSDEFRIDVANFDCGNIGGNDAPLDSFELGRSFRLYQIRPILRPLTDLCTQLPNGKIPAVEMAKLDLIYKKHLDRTLLVDDKWEPIFEYRIIEKSFGKVLKVTSADTWIIYLSFTKISNISHFLFEYLLKNHFDVFGLIEKGLAIDINTLEK